MSKNYTVEYLKSHILNYYDEHGKLPKTSDINEKNNCPNRGVFVKYAGFGSHSNFSTICKSKSSILVFPSSIVRIFF